MVHRHAQHSAWRTSDVCVALGEREFSVWREVRYHDEKVREGDTCADYEDRQPREWAAAAHGVPDPKAAHRSSNLLLCRRREQSEQGEPDESILVQKPDRVQDEWCGEADGVNTD